MKTEFIYKICAKVEWDAATRTGIYAGSEIDLKDGFIHFSTAEQAPETASKHFAGENGLVLVKIGSKCLGNALKWEKSRHGALFPHLYHPLNPVDAEWVAELPLGDDGVHIFPSMD